MTSSQTRMVKKSDNITYRTFLNEEQYCLSDIEEYDSDDNILETFSMINLDNFNYRKELVIKIKKVPNDKYKKKDKNKENIKKDNVKKEKH